MSRRLPASLAISSTRIRILTLALSVLMAAAAFLITFAVAPTPAHAEGVSRSDAPGSTGGRSSDQNTFSDPTWFPLRRAAKVTCVKSDCSLMDGRTRGIDFNATDGDPVYAAGAGIAHVGAGSHSGCSTTGESENGNWIWIDHGGGIVSRYHHLGKIMITDGEQVQPSTQIGTVGNSGAPEPCTTHYLHFEVHDDGLIGLRIATPALTACTSTGKQVLPNIYGTKSWDDPKVHRQPTPTSDSSCLADAWTLTPDRPAVTLSPGAATMKVSWGTPAAGVDKILVRTERYSTALQGYGRPYHFTLDGAPSSTTLKDLTNGRAYRVAVSFHNTYGYSAWSQLVTATPAALPAVGGTPRYLTWPHGKYVHYGWNRSNGNGAEVTAYQVGIRCASKGGSFGAWKTKTMPDTTTTYNNFYGLGSATSCEVRVHAKNRIGWGAWSAPRRANR